MTGDHSEPEKMIHLSPGAVMALFAAVSFLLTVSAAESAEESVDVIEGGAVTLNCRYLNQRS